MREKFWAYALIIAVLGSVLLIGSCQTQKQWDKKGFRRGWVDTVTTYKHDTIHFYGGTKDTLFQWSKDSLILKDKLFTTVIYHDTILKTTYARTTVNGKDTVIVKETHTTNYKPVALTVWQSLKEVWWLGLVIAILFTIIIIRK